MQSEATSVDEQWILALDFYKQCMPKLILLSEELWTCIVILRGTWSK